LNAKKKIIIFGILTFLSITSVHAVVPVIDTVSITKSIQQLNAMVHNIQIQTDLLDQAKRHYANLQRQLSQLQDIKKRFSGPRKIANLELIGELNDILSRNFNGVLSTMLSGASGDWSGITQEKSLTMQETINKSLKSAGLSQEIVSKWSASNNSVKKRTAQKVVSASALAAAGEQSYKEAGQSLERVEKILEDTKKSEDIKESIDNNTRMLAELAIQLTKSLEISSIKAVYTGHNAVIDAADRAEERDFFTFGNK